MKLLIIDDETDLLEMFKEMIEYYAPTVSVTTASSVEEAVLLEKDCDVILSDVHMRNAEALEILLSQSLKPVIRMSGSIDKIAGKNLNKPFSKDELIEILSPHIDKAS